jgi:hypothetical protein
MIAWLLFAAVDSQFEEIENDAADVNKILGKLTCRCHSNAVKHHVHDGALCHVQNDYVIEKVC